MEQIGRYEILDELGEGGMAKVLHAHDPHFKRDVAIKVLPHELLYHPTLRERFDREAQVVAALNHPAIVPVYDYGEHQGQPFLVMRNMTGGTLTDRISRELLSVSDSVHIITRIASALDKAHHRGIIHRDVKPGNILFDQEGNAYLSDFGIARLAEVSSDLTSGRMVGTPAFMAPEIGSPDGLSPLVDVYALGVMLFQMLTGCLPYNTDTPQGMFIAHATQPIPDIHAWRPNLPNGMQALMLRALAKDPTERFASAGALAAALEQVANNESLAAYSASPHISRMTAAASDALTQDVEVPRFVDGTQPTQPRMFGCFVGVAVGIITLIGAVMLGLLLNQNELFPGATGTESETATMTRQPAGSADATITPASVQTGTKTPTPTVPTPAAEPEITLARLGFPGNPVTANAQWEQNIRELDGVEMALVPAGCFMMGSDEGNADELPRHEVCFEQPFWIDLYEVTNRQFEDLGGLTILNTSSYFPGPDRPREQINWLQADTFCTLRGARLPTEAEWEYSARGPDALIYPWGNDFNLENVVSFDSPEPPTADVGSKPGGVSWVGAFDLSGNVLEWVDDWYKPDYYATLGESVMNPNGPASGTEKVMRGGASTDAGFSVHASARDHHSFGPQIGFRCARDWSPSD